MFRKLTVNRSDETLHQCSRVIEFSDFKGNGDNFTSAPDSAAVDGSFGSS